MSYMLSDHWEEFKKTAIPDDAPDEQVHVMKLAYYAGAQAMFSLEDQICELDTTEDVQAEMINTIWEELENFWSGTLIGAKK